MELEECKRKTIGMLRSYRENEVCIKMLEADLWALDAADNYSSNIAVSYDQPGSGATNKVVSPGRNRAVAEGAAAGAAAESISPA